LSIMSGKITAFRYLFVALLLSAMVFLVHSQAYATGWNVITVEAAGAVGQDCSLAIDSKGNPHISYRDQTNSTLKYASMEAGIWRIQTIEGSVAVPSGTYTSIALDSNDNPHIAYAQSGPPRLMKYASWEPFSQKWVISTVETSGYTFSWTSLKLDSNNMPHISYLSYGPFLKYASLEAGSWKVQTVEANPYVVYHTTAGNTSIALKNGIPYIIYAGEDLSSPYLEMSSWEPVAKKWIRSQVDPLRWTSGRSLAMDSLNRPHISYSGVNPSTMTIERLKYATWESGTWRCGVITPVVGAQYTSLAIDLSNDKPHISFYHAGYGLKYATLQSGVWDIQTVEAGAQIGDYCSIALDGYGEPRIAYYDGQHQDLKYAIKDSIPPVATVEAPNGGETIEAGPTGIYIITWEATDIGGFPLNNYISIYLSTDEGASWPTKITTREMNDSGSRGTYIWTVPNVSSDECLISVEARDGAGNKGFDVSDHTFMILPAVPPLVSVEAPNTPDITLESGTTYSISWDATDKGGLPAADYISIYYYSAQPTPAGWKLITSKEANDPGMDSGAYLWTVPDVTAIQSNCYVSVEAKDKAGNTGRDMSNFRFTIVPSREPLVTVEAPSAKGITIEAGPTGIYNITWDATSLTGFSPPPYISIFLSFNGGVTWETLCATEVNDPGTNSGSYEWKLPYVTTKETNCLISVEATSLSLKVGRDVSNNRFTIVPSTEPVVTLEAPPNIPGIILEGGQKYMISWEVTDYIGLPQFNYVSLYLTTDEGASWTEITTQEENDPGKNTGTFEWTVPLNIYSINHCRISIEAVDKAGNIGQPVGSGFWNYFSIVPQAPPVVTVESPSSYITIEGGEKYIITWEATDNGGFPAADYITIRLSTTDGTSWTLIPTLEENDPGKNEGTYLWTVPSYNSGNCYISVEASDWLANRGYGISSKFKLIPSIPPLVTVEAPNAPNITLESLSTYIISWDATDNGGFPSANYISISYYTPSSPTPAGWKPITAIESNDPGTDSGTYEWIVPAVTSIQNNCLVSVEATDKVGNRGRDISDFRFTIIPNLAPAVTVEAPNTRNITLEEGETYAISWDALDLGGFPPPPYISIYLTINGGVTWGTLCTTEENDDGTNSGTYEWVVPGGVDSNNCLISVEATDNTSKVGRDVSNYKFTIVPSEPPLVTVEYPSAPTTIVLEEGGNYLISWEAMDRGGFPPGGDYIAIHFSTNEGLSWITLTTTEENDAGKNSGMYKWNVPYITSDFCRISIEATDKVGNIGRDISDSNFSIVPYKNPVPTLEAPSEIGISLDAGSRYLISWEATDNVGFPPADYVMLYLTTNEGMSWTLISSLEENDPGFDTGTYEWTVPFVSSESCRISVEVADRGGYRGYDISDNDFSIHMNIILGEPTIEAIYVNNIRFLSGDIITSGVHLQLHLLDHNGIATASVEIDGIQMEALSPEAISNPREIWSGHFSIPGNPRHINTHMLRFIVRDRSGVEAVIIMTAIIMTGHVEVIGKPLNYPNPFSPMSGRSTLIQYTLSVDAPIIVALFDITGHEVKRLNFSSGTNGGRAGINNIYWDGRSLSGNFAGNGMYIFEIISDNRLIGSGKMVIMD